MQRKRFNELERLRKLEILNKLKAERELSKEIVSTLKLSATGGFDARSSLSSRPHGSKIFSKSSQVSTIIISLTPNRSFYFITASDLNHRMAPSSSLKPKISNHSLQILELFPTHLFHLYICSNSSLFCCFYALDCTQI